MSAFDEARGSGRPAPASRSTLNRQAANTLRPASGGGAFGGAFDSASSSSFASAGSASYQNADRLYMTTCENIEKDLRKLTTSVAAAKKQVDQVGTSKDTDDLRKKLSANLEKAKDAVKSINTMLKSELAPAVDASDLSQRERNNRKMQQTRYQKDFKEAMQVFQDVANSAASAEKRHPKPTGAGQVNDTTQISQGKKGKLKDGDGEDVALLQRMQQIDFDAAMVEERDEAITDIASAIMEVNETMRDLAQIVDEQGRDIDQIEVNVGQAEEATEKGVEHLKTAEKYQKGYRKWIIVMLLIIVLAAGGIATYFVLQKKSEDEDSNNNKPKLL